MKLTDKFGAYEYKPGKWQVYFTHEGKQVHLTKNFNDTPLKSRSDCRHLIFYLQRRGYDPKRWGQDKTFQFDVAVKTWIGLSTCSEEWLSERKRITEKFLIPHFKKTDIRGVKTIHVNEFEKSLRDRGLGLSYLRNIRDELRTFLRFNRDSIVKMPEFRNIQIQPPAIKWLTPEQQDEVFQKIPQKHLPIFTFLRTYPVRLNEACGLTRNDIFLDAETPYFVIANVVSRQGIFKTFTKTKRVKPYPILPELDWLFQRKEGESNFVFTRNGKKPYRNVDLSAIWRATLKKVPGVPRVSLYQGMKHSFGWGRIEQGYSLEDVSLLMGHSSSKMTRRYAGQTLKRMIEILRGKNYKPLLDIETPKLLELKDNLKNHPLGTHG